MSRKNLDAGSLLDENDIGVNAGAGLRWLLGQTFGLRVDGRYVSTDVGGAINDRQENVEGTLGILWAFGGRKPGDADGDGVLDRRDACPDTPRRAEVDDSGCPIDTDGDGVANGLDRCPATPTGVPVDASGCQMDSDNDGVHDGADRCAGTPRGARVDDRGCPMDDDSDGVFDGLDKCPGTPRGTKVDVKGCKVLFEPQRQTLVLEGVNFEFNSARLTPQAEGILARVALSLKEWSEIRIEIAGHTDAQGSEDYNLELSQRRAEAVRQYLVNAGIDGGRMTAKGYGESQPLTRENTRAGHERNRRVELKKLN